MSADAEYDLSAKSPSRRALVGFAAAASVAPLLSATSASATERDPHASTSDVVYIGGWLTDEVSAATFDPVTGTLTRTGNATDVNSSFAARHPRLPVLYVASGIGSGVVHSYRISRQGELRLTSQVDTGGTGSKGIVSSLYMDRRSQTLLVTNFATGSVLSLPITANGRLRQASSTVQDIGSGPNPRQAGPHPHCVALDASGRWALVADFGADRVFGYRFDRRTRTLLAGPDGPTEFALPAGSGPRALIWHADGRTLYVVSELTATIRTLAWDARSGRLSERQSQSIDTSSFTGTPSASDTKFGPGGRFLYVANRGENTLQVYTIDPWTRIPKIIQRVQCGGSVPWSFSFDRTGRWMLVANQGSDSVNVFSVDHWSGKLAPTDSAISVPGPDGVTFSS